MRLDDVFPVKTGVPTTRRADARRQNGRFCVISSCVQPCQAESQLAVALGKEKFPSDKSESAIDLATRGNFSCRATFRFDCTKPSSSGTICRSGLHSGGPCLRERQSL